MDESSLDSPHRQVHSRWRSITYHWFHICTNTHYIFHISLYIYIYYVNIWICKYIVCISYIWLFDYLILHSLVMNIMKPYECYGHGSHSYTSAAKLGRTISGSRQHPLQLWGSTHFRDLVVTLWAPAGMEMFTGDLRDVGISPRISGDFTKGWRLVNACEPIALDLVELWHDAEVVLCSSPKRRQSQRKIGSKGGGLNRSSGNGWCCLRLCVDVLFFHKIHFIRRQHIFDRLQSSQNHWWLKILLSESTSDNYICAVVMQ